MSKLATFLREAGVDLNRPNQDGDPPAIFAVKRNEQKRLVDLLRLGADINARNTDGCTALMVASMTTNTECVQLLLRRGANVTLTDKIGRTALMIAVGKLGCGEIVGALILAGTNINAQSSLGHSALMYASSGHWYGRGVRQLLAAGADINLRDCAGNTALMCAAVWIRYGDVGLNEPDEPTDDAMSDLLRAGAPIDDIGAIGKSALMLAATFGRPSCVQTLLQAGANVNLKDFCEKTALMYASIGTHKTGVTIDRRLEPNLGVSAGLLLEYGADLNIQDNNGMSALMFAAKYNRCTIITALFCKGAKLNLTDSEGSPAIVHALRMKPEISASATLNFSVAVRLTVCGANPKLRPVHQAVLEECLFQITNPDESAFYMINHEYAIHLCLVNGVMPNFGDQGSYFLFSLFNSDVSLDACKYLIANTCVTEAEMRILRESDYECLLEEDKCELAEEMLCNPWPLSKLSLMAVSSAIGMHPGRKERIGQLPKTILDPVKHALMFNTCMAYLPFHHWADIPLTFSIVHYETLPSPRPFLLHWPCGRKLNWCRCEPCKQKERKFRLSFS